MEEETKTVKPLNTPHRIIYVENLAELIMSDNSGFQTVKTDEVFSPERELEKIQNEYPGYKLEVIENGKESRWIVELHPIDEENK
jgi:hypothetical protein